MSQNIIVPKEDPNINLIDSTDEIKAEYERWKTAVGAGSTLLKTITASGKGVDGKQIFTITAFGASVNAENAAKIADGKKSTEWQGKGWVQADLGGLALIQSVGVKFNSPAVNFDIQVSFDGKNFYKTPVGSMTLQVTTNEMEYFTFPDVIPARFVRLVLDSDTKVSTLQVYPKGGAVEPEPEPTPEPTPEPGPEPQPTGKLTWTKDDYNMKWNQHITAATIKAVTGFDLDGGITENWKFWGRTQTNYASGGSGPSIRYDNKDVQKVNIVAGFSILLDAVKTSPQFTRSDDMYDIKMRGDSHSDGKGGWYTVNNTWKGNPKGGKEYPHPSTSHFDYQKKGASIGSATGGQWKSIMGVLFNDPATGNPVIRQYGNKTGNLNNVADWVFQGESTDTGNLKPGPVLKKISQSGGGAQSVQIRFDEAPGARAANGFLAAIKV